LTRWHGEIRLNFAPAGSGLMIATAATMTSGGLLWIQLWAFSDFTSCCACSSTHSFHTEIFHDLPMVILDSPAQNLHH